jgi:hypothetical protein
MIFDPTSLDISYISATSFSEYHVFKRLTEKFFEDYQNIKVIPKMREPHSKRRRGTLNQNICGNCCSVSDNPIGCYGPEMREFLFNVHEPQFGGCPPGENFPQIIKEKAIIENANTTINDVIQEFSLLHRRGVDIGWLARWCVSEFYRRDNLSGVMGPPGELGQFAVITTFCWITYQYLRKFICSTIQERTELVRFPRSFVNIIIKYTIKGLEIKNLDRSRTQKQSPP